MQRVCFVIGDRPQCIWTTDPLGKNIEFLRNVDPGYFEYVGTAHEDRLNGGDQTAAALSIRAAYFQGLEALFAFLCATVQSPHCVFGWLDGYKTNELRETVGRVSQGQDIKSVLQERPIIWEAVSQRIHAGVISDDDEKQHQLVAAYAQLWRRLASDFLDPRYQKEYNCIKHGFRAKSTGFSSFTFGDSSFDGSDYGCRFFGVEKIANSRCNSFVHLHGINWSPINLVKRLHLISTLLSNIINRLLQWFGQPITPEAFKYPADFEAFRSPWNDGIQAMAIDIRYGFEESSIRLLSEDEILAEYAKCSIVDAPDCGDDVPERDEEIRASDSG